MPEQVQEIEEQLGGRYALWFVPGAWWAVSLEADGTIVMPAGQPPWPPCHSN